MVMQRCFTPLLLFLGASFTPFVRSEDGGCTSVSIVPGAVSPFLYTLVNADGTIATPVTAADASLEETSVTLCDCQRLVFADRSWRPHVEVGLSAVTVGEDTSMVAQRFGTASLCEATACETGTIPIEAFVNVRGEVPVTVTVENAAGEAVWTDTTGATDLAYLSGCVPSDECLSVSFSAESTPIYASGRVILDGTIVVDQSLDLAGGCQYPMGAACANTGVAANSAQSVLGVTVTTKGAGPYSPYGLSYGVKDQSLVPLNGPGFEGLGDRPATTTTTTDAKVYQQYFNIDASDSAAADCTNVYVDNKYGADAADVSLTLNGVVLENGVTDGTRTTYPITECTSSTDEARRLSGGGLFGVIFASLLLCCCIAAVLNYANEFYTDRMGDMNASSDGASSSAAGR